MLAHRAQPLRPPHRVVAARTQARRMPVERRPQVDRMAVVEHTVVEPHEAVAADRTVVADIAKPSQHKEHSWPSDRFAVWLPRWELRA